MKRTFAITRSINRCCNSIKRSAAGFKAVRLTAAALAVTFAASTLTGCGLKDLGTAHAKSGLKEKYENTPVNTVAISDFDRSLQEFIEEAGYADENYMISTTSFRSALALAVAGADTETKEELIHVVGFENMDEVNAWYYSVEKIIDDFDQNIEDEKKYFKEHRDWYDEDATAPDGSLILLNSVWKNTDKPGKFGKEYVNYVKKNYKAEANNVSASEITQKVNDWVNEGTNGLIPTISDDLSATNAVLVNTLYLNSTWKKNFNSALNITGDFTTSSGDKVKKEFMNDSDMYRYYEDKHGKLIVVPMKGGIDAVFVLGDIKDVKDALSMASLEDVDVRLPKFEIESNFSHKEFLNYLIDRGAELPFSDNADFSVMCPDQPLKISDIVQKTKITIDEDGLEAAAATAIMMDEACCEITEEPKEFIANEPFKFYICGGENDSEVLFSGQIVK